MNTECNGTTAPVFIDGGIYLTDPLGVALRLVCVHLSIKKGRKWEK